MATDFRSGREFPRPGRNVFGGYSWLLRVFDKGRAFKNGTIHDYIYPCPMDKGVFERWGISPAEFDRALLTCATDEQILAWVNQRVSPAGRDDANRWLEDVRKENLDRQDAEETLTI